MIVPKGKLIPIGGKEARSTPDRNDSESSRQIEFNSNGVLQQVLMEMKGPDSRIVVITTASQIPDEMGEMYIRAFNELGCSQVHVLHLDGRNVNSQKSLETLAAADGVFFTGGDQTRLTDKICDSKFMDLLRERYVNEDFVIAGTSAGAMAMSATTIKEGSDEESLLKGIVELERGFSLLPDTIIDTHFMSRGRFSRLSEALLANPGFIALGICEDTGLVIEQGGIMRTIGSGVVLLLEADKIKETNFKKAKKLQPVYVEGMHMHILAKGAGYSLKDRKFLLIEDK
ncbi:cyanophycinase [Dyadobacter flavalbus]|uniref:Cyanophycinase n=1 Tax=Dyadobacter flavalbus TaxID=2579942 RepID=A0A5M8QU40_9BACT|nr:cyanophycinase [Dyadobacter flavalbus]KAA6439795.1 cyanophycinase [Dyadobacter flavalbus]